MTVRAIPFAMGMDPLTSPLPPFKELKQEESKKEDISPTCVVEAAEAAAATPPVPIAEPPPIPNLTVVSIAKSPLYCIRTNGHRIFFPNARILTELTLEGKSPPKIVFVRRTLYHPHLFHLRIQHDGVLIDKYIQMRSPSACRFIHEGLREQIFYFPYPPAEFTVEDVHELLQTFQVDNFHTTGVCFNRHGVIFMGTNEKKEARFFWLPPDKAYWIELSFSGPNSSTVSNPLSPNYLETTSAYFVKNTELSFGTISGWGQSRWFINREFASAFTIRKVS